MRIENKFNDMISRFNADFQLEIDGMQQLKMIDKIIREGNSKIIADIELLYELCNLLETGRAVIIVNE